jgi:hypothetical protein
MNDKYRTTLLETREDIDWAIEVHVKDASLKGKYRFAILYGNEDSPAQIEFWEHDKPRYDWKANFSWEPSGHE